MTTAEVIREGWAADGAGDGYYFVWTEDRSRIVAKVPVPIHSLPVTDAQAQADVALIASAPRTKQERDFLLISLEMLLSRITMVGDKVKTSFGPGELAAARAAIAKCREGETS